MIDSLFSNLRQKLAPPVAMTLFVIAFQMGCKVEIGSDYEVDPKSLGSPFVIFDEVEQITAGESPRGIAWLHFGTLNAPSRIMKMFEENLLASKWEKLDHPFLNQWMDWNSGEGESSEDRPSLFHKAVWRNPTTCAVFTYNVIVEIGNADPGDLDNPKHITVEQTMYSDGASDEFLNGFDGWSRSPTQISAEIHVD